MHLQPCCLKDVWLLQPEEFRDERGFLEIIDLQKLQNTGLSIFFKLQNLSRSKHMVLRGLHYQIEKPQAKLIRVLRGEVFDVVVDLRRSSPTFGKWHGLILSEENRQLLYVPEGFAHGFLTLSEISEFEYNCTEAYYPDFERCIRFDDPDLAIAWPLPDRMKPLLSDKDNKGGAFAEICCFP